MATPYVTGIAALILSENPNLSAIQVKNKIMDSCDARSALSAYCVTGGIVNAYKSVLGVFSHNVVSATSTITTSISPGEYRWYRFTAPASGSYRFYTEGELDTIGELYGNSGPINYCDDLESQDEGSESDYNFYFVQTLSAGETVYLRVTIHSGESAGTYTLKVRDL